MKKVLALLVLSVVLSSCSDSSPRRIDSMQGAVDQQILTSDGQIVR